MLPSNLSKKDKYISLGTYRKNGELKRTPVWFVHDGERIFVYTDKSSWKVSRVRNNKNVVFAPCNGSGKNLGEGLRATAEIHEIDDLPEVMKLFRRKYRLLFPIFAFISRRKEHVFLSLDVESVEQTAM